MLKVLVRLMIDRKAATAVEYGLIVALIVIAMVGALIQVAGVTTGMWNNITTQVQAAHG